MRGALLSAGPSLARTFDPGACGPFDVTIAVNTAAALFSCDWWSCADECRLAEIQEVGFPALFTMEPERDKMLARHPDRMKGRRVAIWREVGEAVEAPTGWASWSCTSALVLAVWLGVTRLTCYGVDMAGRADVTGQETEHRKEHRWQRERKLWDQLVGWAGPRMTVERVTDDSRLRHPDQGQLVAG